MTAPPYECPTRMIGPVMVCRKLEWWFGVSARSTSHSTIYRRPFRVFFVDIMVPILRSATKRGFLTHTLSPGLSFSIVSPPGIGYSYASENILLRVQMVYNILYTSSEIFRPSILAYQSILCQVGSGGTELKMRLRNALMTPWQT